MAHVFGTDFTFNGKSLSDFGNYILCSFDEKNTTEDTSLNRTISKSSITQMKVRPNHFGITYDDVLTFNMGIVKATGEALSFREYCILNAWLTSPGSPRSLTISDVESDYYKELEYFGMVTAITNFQPYDSKTGIDFTFTCDAPYPYSKEQIYDFTSEQSTSIAIENTSDEWEEEYYPILEITSLAAQTVTIRNSSHPDETLMSLEMEKDQTLTIDNELCIIKDSRNLFCADRDFNFKFISLIPGENTISITGKCEGRFKCRFVRKAGV